MKVCVGGTFNVLHKGHKKLFDKALVLAGDDGSIHIGLVVGDIIRTKKHVNSFEYRRTVILEYISGKKKRRVLIEVLPISTRFGLAVKENYDVIIVSPETLKTADEINVKRRNLGKKPLEVVQIPFVLADDGNPISSTRIINKEINNRGNLL